jgi:hypothetical protein
VRQQQNFAGDVVATHNDLYQVYEGQNLYLRDTILGFILDEKEWYTSVVPWFETDEMNIAFSKQARARFCVTSHNERSTDIFEFQNTLATIVPNEGVSRLISFNKRGYQDSVQRMGIAFVMEGDLVGTYAGQIAYRRNIAGISQCCQETVNFHTIVKLLMCKDYWREQQDLHRSGDSRALQKIETDEIADFAVLAYDTKGFTNMVERGREAIRRQRGEADTLIVFPGFPYYVDMVAHSVYTEYYRTGPNGIQLLTQGPLANGSFRGIPIFETRGYSVYENGIQFQPLKRRVAVGEYYEASNKWRGTRPAIDYKSDWRSIYVYSVEDDEYVKIPFMQMFLNSNMFGGDADDTGGLAPQTQVLADAANAELNKQGGDVWARERYDPRNLHKLENVKGTVKANRKLYMHLCHSLTKEGVLVEPVKTFAHFDLDVSTTSDFTETAQGIVNKMFPPTTEEGSTLAQRIHKAQATVRRLETVPYNEGYFRALAYENVNASVGTDGNFYGFQRDDQSPIEWKQNGFNALDLPSRASQAAGGTADTEANAALWNDPVGAVSYGWFRTIATQGLVRGYDAGLVADCADAVEAVNRVTAKQADIMPTSVAFLADKAPEWLERGTPEDVMFAGLFGQRPPMMLGVPSTADYYGQVDPAARAAAPPEARAARLEREKRERRTLSTDVELLWTPVIDPAAANAQVVLTQTFPQLRILDVLIAGLANLQAINRSQILINAPASSPVDDYMLVLLSKLDIKESEDARKRLIAALYALLNTAEREPGYAKLALQEVASFVNNDLRAAAAALQPAVVTAAAVKADFEKQLQTLAKRVDETRARIAALKKSGVAPAAADVADGNVILGIEFGEVPLRIDQGVANAPVYPMRAETLAQIGIMANTPIDPTVTATNAHTLRAMEENVDELGRKIYQVGDKMLLKLRNYKEWANTVPKDRNISKKHLTAINDAVSSYERVAKDIQEKAVEIYNRYEVSSASASSTSAIGSSFARAGDKVPRTVDVDQTADVGDETTLPYVWFRSPVTNSPALLRSMNPPGQTSRWPMVLPTDVNTNYRSAIIPWARVSPAGAGAPPQRGAVVMDIMSHITSDPAMAAITSDMTMADVKQLHHEPWVRSQMQFDPIEATFFALDAEKMAEHTSHVPVGIRGSANLTKRLDINAIKAQAKLDALESGVQYGDEEEIAIAAQMDQVNAERARAGFGKQSFETDFHRAEADMRIDAHRARAAEVAREAMSSLHPLQAGDAYGGGDDPSLSAIAAENARHFSVTTTSSGFRPRTIEEMRAERRRRMTGVAPPRDRYDVHNLNRSFAGERARFMKGYEVAGAGDYMAQDDAYLPSADELREAAFLRHVGFNPPESGDYRVSLRERLMALGFTKARAPRHTVASEAMMHQNVRYRFAKAHALRDPLLKVAMLALLHTNNDYVSWREMIQADVPVPINFIVWRLWIEGEYNTCILMQSGIETGANVLGHTNLVFSNTSADKMMHGHFTYHQATMIWNQQFVHHLVDVMPTGYIAGWDTDFITSVQELGEDDRGSVIVTPIPVTEHTLGRKICFIRTSNQRFVPSVTNRPKQQTAVDDHSGAAFAELTFGLSEDKVARSNTGQTWNDSAVRLNVMAYKGTCFTYNPPDEYFSAKTHGLGHLGGNRTGPGVRNVFLGAGNAFCNDQRLVDASLRLP